MQHIKYTRLIDNAGRILPEDAIVYTADSETVLDYSWTEAPEDEELEIVITRADVVSLWIQSDVDCTITTNGAGEYGDDTLELEAGIAYYGDDNHALPINAFTADITALYLTSEATEGTLKVRVLYNA